MDAKEVIQHAAKSISHFRFPAGVLVLMGCLIFSVGVIKGEASLSNKHLLLGLFTFSVGAVLGELRHFLWMAGQNFKHAKGFHRFEGWPWWNVLNAAILLYLAIWSGRLLWPLVHN